MEIDPHLYYIYGVNPLLDSGAIYALYREYIDTIPEPVLIAPSKLEDSLNSWRMFCQKQRLTLNYTSNKETEMIKLFSKK